jgi:hypothetical protein
MYREYGDSRSLGASELAHGEMPEANDFSSLLLE